VEPLLIAVIAAGAVSAFAWIASLVTKDCSWVDRLWSIAPIGYVWIFAIASGFDARATLMAVLVTAWGARLTFNFARKGGYSGVEDYRWPILRARMRPWQFQVFNLLFIVLFQNAVILLMTLPIHTAFEHRGGPLTAADAVLAIAFLACLAGETVADEQQWRFQAAKRAGGPEFRPRFVQSGLWRYSRHPNYFFELAQWWIVFLFGAVAAGTLLEWTVAGAALLTILFVGSTIFTESITRSRYPEYADYQATTSPIVPWFPRRRSASAVA